MRFSIYTLIRIRSRCKLILSVMTGPINFLCTLLLILYVYCQYVYLFREYMYIVISLSECYFSCNNFYMMYFLKYLRSYIW